ncbi:MAG: amino acid ABC transporter permease [Peptococcaceae bacterium]|nr:amino acid ABC transporter permease [Peptococcaceae bacterium]
MELDYILNSSIAILKGFKVTYGLFFSTLIFSLPLGLLVALARISRYRILQVVTGTYIWLLRGTPLLLQVFFVYFGLPALGLTLNNMTAAILAFALNYAAYFAEIFRSGIQSINKGQYESADVLGLTYAQTMRRKIIPQMVKRVLPPVSNEVITLVKDTALVFGIGLLDVLRTAQIIVTRDFDITAFIIAAVFYLLNTAILTFIFRKLEQRYSYYTT